MNARLTNPLRFFAVALGFTALTISTPLYAASTVVQHNYPGVIITGTAGKTYPIEYVNVLANVNAWQSLTNIVLPASPYLFIDTSAPDAAQRFYRDTNSAYTVKDYVGLTITGNVGSTNLIQYLDGTNWITLTNLVLPSSPYFFVDTISPHGFRRVFRAEDLAGEPVITSAGLAFTQIGLPFSYQITANSYLPVTGYSAVGLPPGLGVNPGNGLISGTPTQIGTNIVTIGASNSGGTGTSNLTLRVVASVAPELVSIPAGTFSMGSPVSEAGRSANEGPQTQVTITYAFAIGKYEVKQTEYQAVAGSNPSFFKGDFRPVSDVTYQDATNYCALLTARDRQSGHISASSTYRLPTEAEWEYAARAGTTTPYSFGNNASNLTQHGWFTLNSGGANHPVGQKVANPWGLFDVHGNDWELCADWFGAYPGGSVTDPHGPAIGTERVLRGGSWFSTADYCRSAVRLNISPAGYYSDVGFRIVLVTGP